MMRVALTAFVEAGCTPLLSKDMQDGCITSGLTVVNGLAKMCTQALVSARRLIS